MIRRYTRPEMGAVWTDENKYSCWLKVELAVCEAWAKRGEIPPDAMEDIRSRAAFDVERIEEIEAVTHHDVIAFITNVAEHVGHSARYIHLGMTSSDVLDTALALQTKDAGSLLLRECERLVKTLAERALEFREIPAVGRTHGIHAEPVSFGLRFARFYEQMVRGRERLKNALQQASVGKLSGAVGCYAHLDPAMEEEVMARLELDAAPISTQIVSRDRHADLLAAIAQIGTVLESIALEVRHLQRTEVNEAREGFARGQKGSSAMPHKRNPINAEKICGMARLLRANMHAAFENVALWHERDISHSSVERVIFPDSFIALDYMLALTNRLAADLVVDTEKLRANLELTGGAIFSEGLLLELVKSGYTREEAYKIVQKVAHQALDTGVSFKEAVLQSEELVKLLDRNRLEAIFDLEHVLRNVESIYCRLGLFPSEPSKAR